MRIGERLIEFRKKYLLSQAELGELLGVCRSAVQRIESKKNVQHVVTEARWSRMLDEAERKLREAE